MVSAFLKSAISAQKLYRTVSSKCSCGVALMYGSNNNVETIRGICVYRHRGQSILDTQSLINVAMEMGYLRHFSVSCIQKGSKWRFKILEKDSKSNDIISDKWYRLSDNSDVPSDPAFCQSRLFSSSDLCPVYHSYKDTRDVLKKCTNIPEVVALLDIADKHIPENFDVNHLQQSLINHPFVVVEGLDATGKTTLTETLEKKLNATRYYTPPPEISDLRKFFDTMPEIIRRAYYCIGNYIVAIQISQECQTKSVIMDRFWHSTTAYGIANETSSSDLPSKGHWVYTWPTDLIKPTLVLFLTVTEEVRKQRIMGRGGEKTFEEKHLDKDKLFRARLCEAYRRMDNPRCIEIDAAGTKEEVVREAVEVLKKHDINL